MTKTEAESLARQCLYNYRENAARLAQKLDKYEIVRQRGSRTVQKFGDGGVAIVTYIDSTPLWIDEMELLEREIQELRLRVLPIQRLLRNLEETRQEALVVYRLKYERRLSWRNARDKASEEYGIGWRTFNRCDTQLLDMSIRYLDLRLERPCAESGTESGSKMVCGFSKTP